MSLSAELQGIISSLSGIKAEFTLVCGILGLLTLDLIKPLSKQVLFVSSVLIYCVSFFFLRIEVESVSLFMNSVWVSPSTQLYKILLLVGSVLSLVILQFSSYKKDALEGTTEYHIVLMSLVLGGFAMISANHFLVFFIGFETVSIMGYLLIMFNSENISREASLKYLLFGLVSAAIILYGISLVFVDVKSLYLNDVLNYFSSAPSLDDFQSLGVLFILLGLAFKLGAVPMHLWVPDAYQGAKYPVLAIISTLPKIPALLFLGHLLYLFSGVVLFNKIELLELVAFLSLLSITIGNVIALWQNNAKRLMAYSGIAHSGFLLVGLVNYNLLGWNATLFYLTIYLFINITAFFYLAELESITGSQKVNDYQGVGKSKPYFGVIGVVIFAALTGLPPTVGFTAKLLVFTALFDLMSQVDSVFITLLFIFGLINTVIGLFYYIKIPYFMFFRELKPVELRNITPLPLVILAVASVLILLGFVFPGVIYEPINSINELANNIR